jgi:hypothetical protein
MKTMLVSIAIILAISVGCVYNCYKAQIYTDLLISKLDSIDGIDDLERIDQFVGVWAEYRTFFAATLPMNKIEIADSAVIVISASKEAGSSEDFIRGRILAKNAIYELALYSSFDIQNIL